MNQVLLKQGEVNTPNRYVLVVEGRSVELKSGMVIGRGADCDITLRGRCEASRRHARFLICPAGLFIEDLGSTNGTYVGSLRVGADPVRLLPEDLVRVGGCVMRARLSDAHTEDAWSEPTPAYGVRLPAEAAIEARYRARHQSGEIEVRNAQQLSPPGESYSSNERALAQRFRNRFHG